MDEPLSNLDAKLRVSTRGQIAALQRRLGVTTLYVTHDQVEAMTEGDRVAVLQDGILQQCDTPQVLYADPVNAFVAGFIGSPAMNIVEGTLTDDGVLLGSTIVPLSRETRDSAGAGPDRSLRSASGPSRSRSRLRARAFRRSSASSSSSARRPTSTRGSPTTPRAP